jgi:hypothetical protein
MPINAPDFLFLLARDETDKSLTIILMALSGSRCQIGTVL